MNINNLGKFVILWLCLQILSFLQIGNSLAKTYESRTYEINVKEVSANATLARNNAVDYAYLRAYYQFVADLLSKYRVSLHNFGSRNADFSRGDNFDNRDYNYNSYIIMIWVAQWVCLTKRGIISLTLLLIPPLQI